MTEEAQAGRAAIVQVGAVTVGLLSTFSLTGSAGLDAAVFRPSHAQSKRTRALRAPRRFRQSPLNGRRKGRQAFDTKERRRSRPTAQGRVARRLEGREAAGASRRNVFQIDTQTLRLSVVPPNISQRAHSEARAQGKTSTKALRQAQVNSAHVERTRQTWRARRTPLRGLQISHAQPYRGTYAAAVTRPPRIRH